jgi:hypothetical protein
MAEQLVTVHRSDPTDTEIPAVVEPPEAITRTDDPALVRAMTNASCSVARTSTRWRAAAAGAL